MKKPDLLSLYMDWGLIAFAAVSNFLLLVYFLYSSLQNILETFLVLLFMITTLWGLFSFVNKYYGEKRFLRFYKTVPIISLVAVTILFYVDPYLKNALVNLVIGISMFSFAFFVTFVALFTLRSLKNGKHKLQTLQIYRVSWKIFYVYILIISMCLVFLYLIALKFVKLGFSLEMLGYLTIVIFQYSVLTWSTAGFFLSYENKLRYCKTGLEVIKGGLGSLHHAEKREIVLKDFLPVFPTLISRYNEILDFYPNSPHIQGPHTYHKVLYISVVSRNKRLIKTANRGLEQMIDSLGAQISKGKPSFYRFIKGLTLTTGEKKRIHDVIETFELAPGPIEWVKRNIVYIGIVFTILSVVLSIIK